MRRRAETWARCAAVQTGHSSEKRQSLGRQAAAAGLTLLETAICIMIVGVLSVGVSSLVKTGIESQLAQRTQENMQAIGVNIVDDLRRDIRLANSAAVSADGRTLTLSMTGGNVIYNWTNANDFTRQDFTLGGTTKTYNDTMISNSPQLQVDCNDAASGVSRCFTATRMNSDPTPQPRQIRINAIRVYQNMPAGSRTVIDQYFQTPSFILRQFSFDVMSATEFQ